MKQINRRKFLKRGSIFTSILAVSPLGFKLRKSILKISIPNFTKDIQVIHSSGLKAQIDSVEFIGGLNSMQKVFKEASKSIIYVDSGNFLSQNLDFESNLFFVKNLVSSGLTLAVLGSYEMALPSVDLQKLIRESKLKVLGSNLENKGLVLGETYFSRAIITSGKYKVGILSVSDTSCTSLNSKALELRLLYQCDLIIGVGNPPVTNLADGQNYFDQLHEVDHLLVGDQFSMPLGTRMIHSKKGKEIWVSRPADLGRFIGSFQYKFNSDYKICQFSNDSFIPGNDSIQRKFALLHQSLNPKLV